MKKILATIAIFSVIFTLLFSPVSAQGNFEYRAGIQIQQYITKLETTGLDDKGIITSLNALKSKYVLRLNSTKKESIKVRINMILNTIDTKIQLIQTRIDENDEDNLLGDIYTNNDLQIITSCQINSLKNGLNIEVLNMNTSATSLNNFYVKYTLQNTSGGTDGSSMRMDSIGTKSGILVTIGNILNSYKGGIQIQLYEKVGPATSNIFYCSI